MALDCRRPSGRRRDPTREAARQPQAPITMASGASSESAERPPASSRAARRNQQAAARLFGHCHLQCRPQSEPPSLGYTLSATFRRESFFNRLSVAMLERIGSLFVKTESRDRRADTKRIAIKLDSNSLISRAQHTRSPTTSRLAAKPQVRIKTQEPTSFVAISL